jgi:Tol biopolymer transport system component
MLTAYHYWLFDFRSDAVGDARLTCTDLSVNSCNIGQVWTTQVLTTELDNLPGWSPDGSGIVFMLNAGPKAASIWSEVLGRQARPRKVDG